MTLYHDINCINVVNKLKVLIKRKFKNCNFLTFFFNWNISVINGANFIKFVTLVVGCHSEGTVSQIFYLGPSFYFMKSRNLCSQKW